MEVRELTNLEKFRGLKEEWNDILCSMPNATIFQTWEWSWIWWSHFSVGQLWVLVAQKNGEVVGIAPLYVHRLFGSLRWVKLIGNGRMSNTLDFLARPSHAVECHRVFLDFLARSSSKWDLVDLLHIPQPAAESFAGHAGTDEVLSTPADIDLYIDLPKDTDAYAEQLDGKFKRNIRRRKKLVAADFSSLEYERVEGDDVEVGMNELFRLHELRWQGRELFNILSDDSDRRFHADVAKQLDPIGLLRLYRLKLDGVTRAVLYGFDCHGCTAAYATRFDPELVRYGLGILVHEHVIMRSIEGGSRRFDLMRGPEAWKYRFGAKEKTNYHVEVRQASFRSNLAFRANRLGYQIWQIMMDERKRLTLGEAAATSFWSRTIPRLLISGAVHRLLPDRRDEPNEPKPPTADETDE